MEADGLFVPGVGAFSAVMEQLDAVRGGELIDRRLAGGRPVLGICVGMQVLFERGVERGVDTEGLGEWPGAVDRAGRRRPAAHGLEHRRRRRRTRVLFDGIRDERFYFVHSYAAQEWTLDRQPPVPAAAGDLGRPRRAGSSPPSRTARSRRRSSTPRSRASRASACSRNWLGPLTRPTVVSSTTRSDP